MKLLPKLLISSLAFLFITIASTAQSTAKTPKWLPEKGNWMVETNTNQPLHTVIYFYTDNGEIIYKKTIDGVKFNIEKRKVKMQLKKMLGDALVAWEQGDKSDLATKTPRQ